VKTLRGRLILSHILPPLLIIPIMGIVLVTLLDTQFILPRVTQDLENIAHVLAAVAVNDPPIWSDPTLAGIELPVNNQADPSVRIMFIRPDGRLLASSDPADASQVNTVLAITGLSEAREGKSVTRMNFSMHDQREVIDVLVPAVNSQGQVIGVVRVSYLYDTVLDELLFLRNTILVILLVGLVFGTLFGFVLASQIQAPIQQVTRAIGDLARGDRRDPLREEGAEEIRILARSVNGLLERLNSLEQARGRLLANLVHELGRPLGALRVAMQAIMQGAKQDTHLLDELVPGMDEQVSRLQQLLEELTHLHDQVIGTLELNREGIVLGDWLPLTLRPWQEVARQKHLSWKVEIPAGLPSIRVDAMRLAQAVGNLVSNAIKYTPPGGAVTISVSATPETTWIRVADTGPGIPWEEQKMIFTPFFRGRQGRRFQQGMGLGLSIARDLVVAHAGHLEMESTPGEGSRFTIVLPNS
jgi:signal transduction histidine kinase